MAVTTSQTITTLASRLNINRIYARHVFHIADKNRLFEDANRIVNEKPKPFVKWVGGKRQLLKQFHVMGLYPPDDFDPLVSKYFEPFVGGGAVFFDLLPPKVELSDQNSELIRTYKVIKNDVLALIKSLKMHKHDKEYYLRIRAKNPETMSDVEAASRFIFLNRTGFNGLYRVNSKGAFNVPFGKYSNPMICDEENLRKVSKALRKVIVKKQDYKAVLKKAKEGDFVYFDPPYFPVSRTASFVSYTADSFLENEQAELRDTFVELHKRGCFAMLSNSDTPFINKLYSGIKGVRVSRVSAKRAVNSNAAKRGKIYEVLVTNY